MEPSVGSPRRTVKRWPKLNELQLTVLQRIGNPAETTGSGDWELAKTVYALRDRGLVKTVKGEEPRWVAEITEAGRFYLEHGHPPDDALNPPPAQTGLRRAELSADELLAALAANNNVVTLENPDDTTRALWRRALHRTKREGRVPEGFHLQLRGQSQGDFVMALVEGRHPHTQYQEAKPPRIELPLENDLTHPVVSELRARLEALATVSADSLPRALLLVRALVDAAERHGHDPAIAKDNLPAIVFQSGTLASTLIIGEESEVVEQVPNPEADGKKVYGWQRVQPQLATVSTGRLTFELADNWKFPGRRRRWADRTRWRLEDKLGDVLAELDARAAIGAEQVAAEEQARAERRAEWEQAMARAREQYLEDYRYRTLLDQVNARNEARDIAEYCDALDAAADQEQNEEWAAEIRSWSQWARSRAEPGDPLRGRPTMPPDPEPKPKDLRPYLDGWSPDGPDER
jgi:DNA-binding IscR family transcriptional regulator